MISVKSVLDITHFIDLVDYLISIFLGPCCEDCYLIVKGQVFYEFFCMRSNMKKLSVEIKVNKSLVEVKNQKFLMMSY